VAARVTDWGLAALLVALIASGALTLFAGASDDAWVFALHDALGAAITILLAIKLLRVWNRLARPTRHGPRVLAGAFATGLAGLALISGFLWSAGATPAPAGYSLLSWHDALGAILVIAVVAHMVLRAKPLRRRDLAHRRQFLTATGLAAGSFLAWRTQRPVLALLELRGARRRFTGSYEADSFAGNAFPSTSWVADNPRPIDLASYRLRVTGLVARSTHFSLDELAGDDAEITATLDCTGGFYSTQRWRGIRLDRLLNLAGADPQASHISVASRTGYRWSFARADAHRLLLATEVGGEPLGHEHGAPVRLVAPGTRGFQWVKWVDLITLLDHPDYGAPASTVWSSFTAAGRGDA
jgi:DMSO/TMAO reductase YedYZ molybdopterin-dependent catalytic subunit